MRERPYQNHRIDDRNNNQNTDRKQPHLRGKPCVIGKCIERVGGGMEYDAGKQASTAVENRNEHKADRDGKDDLAQIAQQLHPAAVKQVDDMSVAKMTSGT